DDAFDAIRMTLDYLGTPYDVLNATTGPPLTEAALEIAPDHGRYYAVILDVGALGTQTSSALSDDEWTTLANYEAEFAVRRAALYAFPSDAYGLVPLDDEGVDVQKSPLSVTCTPA